MTVSQCIQSGVEKMQQASIHCHDFSQHMRQLVSSQLDCSMSELVLKENEEINPPTLKKINHYLNERCQGKPLQYLLGYEWFWNSKFEVGPGVLVPRRETEHLVEALLKCRGEQSIKVAELGAGSGNIGISCLQERKKWNWYAFEKNPLSIPYLEKNIASLLGTPNTYHLVKGDFFELAGMHAPFDAVVSNPPYITQGVLNLLPFEVRQEPAMALDGGELGVAVIEKLIVFAAKHLVDGGIFLSEIGFDQETLVKSKLEMAGFTQVEVKQDYQGLPRLAVGFFCKNEQESHDG